MKCKRIAALVITLIVAPQAQAEGPLAGIIYGQVSLGDFETENLGFVVGHSNDAGFGFEAFYLETVSEDSESRSGRKADISIDTWGILGVYKSAGDIYFKGKVGAASVKLEFDIKGGSDASDSTLDFAYGLAVGTEFGNGAFELSYTILPSFDEFQDVDFDEDADMIAISYQLNL